jgi:pimeloyl-ACP methyl ester carboxylesterase
MAPIEYKTVEVDSVKIFYREAGSVSLPGLLLLHGHASASHTFRNILPELSNTFHVVAPDYPGFGNSDRLDPSNYSYTFVNLANTIDKFTEQIGLTEYIVYLFDFGAPIGLMLASKHPERIRGLFTQSGNAYDEGLAPPFEGIKDMWAHPNDPSKMEPLRGIFTPAGIQHAYTHGVGNVASVGPDAPALDTYYTSREGAIDVQLALLRDYENNVKTYPEWQAWLRKHKPKVVGVWGKNDPFFASPGAEAFKRDVPDADISIIEDGGHFMIESHPQEIVKGLKKLL